MKKSLSVLCAVAALLLLAAAARAQEADTEGSKDHPLFNRMPGYYIHQYEDKDFDTHNFLVDGKEVAVEGHLTQIMYLIQPGAKEPSRAQILRNYEQAVLKIGGKVLTHDSDGSSYLKVAKDGKEIWVDVGAYITSQYALTVVEKGEMAQEITANAAAFAGDIKSTGHTAVYGIYFDSGKSVVKPNSEPALAEIVKLLKGDNALKLYVVGHTDAVGGIEANMKLSQARAEAVAQALIAKGFAAARLKGYGVGPLAPVASNDSEEGKAKNRRVELVKQ